MPFDFPTKECPMTINIIRGALNLKEKGATPKAIRSWLIGRTTFQERNQIMDSFVHN